MRPAVLAGSRVPCERRVRRRGPRRRRHGHRLGVRSVPHDHPRGGGAGSGERPRRPRLLRRRPGGGVPHRPGRRPAGPRLGTLAHGGQRWGERDALPARRRHRPVRPHDRARRRGRLQSGRVLRDRVRRGALRPPVHRARLHGRDRPPRLRALRPRRRDRELDGRGQRDRHPGGDDRVGLPERHGDPARGDGDGERRGRHVPRQQRRALPRRVRLDRVGGTATTSSPGSA